MAGFYFGFLLALHDRILMEKVQVMQKKEEK